MSNNALPISRTVVLDDVNAGRKSVPVKPFRRRLVILLLLTAAALGVAMVTIATRSADYREQLADEEFAELTLRDTESFDEFESIVEYISLCRLYNDEPLNAVSHESLRRADAFYTAYVDRSQRIKAPQFMIAVAHFKLGSIRFLLRDFRKCEESYSPVSKDLARNTESIARSRCGNSVGTC